MAALGSLPQGAWRHGIVGFKKTNFTDLLAH
jgi:hypothetical protein